MTLWKKLDLAGRTIVLLSIAFQLTLVSELQTVKQNGDIYYLMENQSWMADMIYSLSSTGEKSGISSDNTEARSRIKLYSEWKGRGLHSQIRIVNIIFVIFFLIGSALAILGRYLEINE